MLLGKGVQREEESLDTFANALIHIANRAYPDTERQLRSELVRDRFVAGVRSEHVQEALLRTPQATLDDARTAATREKAAQTARKRMRARRVATCVVSSGEGLIDVTPGTTTGVTGNSFRADFDPGGSHTLAKSIPRIASASDFDPRIRSGPGGYDPAHRISAYYPPS